MKKPFTLLSMLLALTVSFSTYSQSVPVLNSHPAITATTATVFLDFDGQYVQSSVWNGGNPINAAASGLTSAQITEVFNRVAEDFRPFDINVTTDSLKFFGAPLEKRMRVIITPTSAWRQGVGGIAYTGSFIWGDDTPCFVFNDRLGPNNTKMVAEACSHETGHTVGLSHQSRYDGVCNMTETYHSGTGLGEIAWAPIMGNSYYRNMSGWNNGPTQFSCTEEQDNLSIITSQNGFGYRIDDYTETLNTGTNTINPTSFTRNGIITTTTDRDAFRFNLSAASAIHIDAKPYSAVSGNDGANLDIKVQLYNASLTLVRTYDPTGAMNVAIDTTLGSGTWYVVVDGTGNANISDYGSLGSYTLSGFSGSLPIRDVSLSGTSDRGKHNLRWNIVADEPIKTIVVEASGDGSNYHALTNVTPAAANFSYVPFEKTDMFYRLKVTSVINQTVYSNIVSLKAVNKADRIFNVSTFVNNEIAVNASENYQYSINDINGKQVMTGNGKKGINKIDVQNKPSGIYVIQIVSNNDKITERIIKQ
jgi:Secretion system C-terminal sorting domain